MSKKSKDKFVDVKYRDWDDTVIRIIALLLFVAILGIPSIYIYFVTGYAGFEANTFCDTDFWGDEKAQKECYHKNAWWLGGGVALIISIVLTAVLTCWGTDELYKGYEPKIVRYKVKTNGKIKDGEQISP